jgi:hypothetical protein
MGEIINWDKDRWYRGQLIFPKNVYSMYSCNCNGVPLAADTLAGIKQLIKKELGNGPS